MPIPNFSKMTKAELLKFAAKKRIPLKPALLKAQIIALLQKELKKTAKPKKVSAKAGKQIAKKIPASTGRTAVKKVKKKEASAKPVKAKAKTKTAAKSPKKAAPKIAKAPAKKPETSKVATSAVKHRKSVAKKQKPTAAAKVKTPAKAKAKTLHPQFELEDMAQEAKFIVGPAKMHDESAPEAYPELPGNYGDNKLVFMLRDPYYGFVYWELQQEKIDQGLKTLARSLDAVRCVLRVHRVDQRDAGAFDVDVDFRSGKHYLPLSPPGARFYAEIGLLDPEGNFVALAMSNTLALPLDGPSDIIDDQWMTTDEAFEKIYALSGGGSYDQGGSQEIQKLRREQRRIAFADSSPGVGSFSSPATGQPGTGEPQ